jgi:hypothetical protein
MHRIRRVSLQLVPQFQDMVVHGPSRRIVLETPNLTQKFRARNDAFGILYHEFQGLEFLRRKRNWLTATCHLHLRKAHSHIIKNKCVFHIDPRRAPQGGAHTREQLPWAERLGHVVIGTNFQQQNFVQHIRAGIKDLKLASADKLFRAMARRFWRGWKKSPIIVTPETVIPWHRAGFRAYRSTGE